jgi:hypothetical protein
MLTITLFSLVVAAASGLVAWRSIRREHLRADARVASLAAAIDERSALDTAFERNDQTEAGVSVAIFADQPISPAARQRPLLRAGIGLIAVLAVVVLIAMTGDRYNTPTPQVVSPHAESIELLSLHAARDRGTLAVTGVVRSRTEAPLAAITAVVSAVDAEGRTVGRGSATLARLLPRHESRFVVTLTDVNRVARYRVSFRGAAGAIRHVDRRGGRVGHAS